MLLCNYYYQHRATSWIFGRRQKRCLIDEFMQIELLKNNAWSFKWYQSLENRTRSPFVRRTIIVFMSSNCCTVLLIYSGVFQYTYENRPGQRKWLLCFAALMRLFVRSFCLTLEHDVIRKAHLLRWLLFFYLASQQQKKTACSLNSDRIVSHSASCRFQFKIMCCCDEEIIIAHMARNDYYYTSLSTYLSTPNRIIIIVMNNMWHVA